MTRSTVSGPALALAASAITVALLELGARAVAPPALPRVAMYRPAAEVAYELVPGWEGRGPLRERIRINAAGLRGPELTAPQPGVLRILVLGDSFTFGLGVAEEDAFPAALARVLTRVLPGIRTEVLNAGVPGYNLYQEARALAARVDRLAPDVVVLGFVENDLDNLDGSDFIVTADGVLVPRPGSFHASVSKNPFSALAGPWLWLQLHSAAFRMGSWWAIRRSLAVHGDGEIAALARRAEESNELPSRLLRGEDDDATATRWAAAARELQAVAGTAERIGVPLVLVLLPRPEQLYSRRLCGGFARLRTMAEYAGIQVVDPVRVLADEPERLGLYLFPVDHHPSPRGQMRLAEVTAARLVAGNILPHWSR